MGEASLMLAGPPYTAGGEAWARAAPAGSQHHCRGCRLLTQAGFLPKATVKSKTSLGGGPLTPWVEG